MGLIDVLNGMQNGPRGPKQEGGGMSPLTMAMLGLLAYKAYQKMSASPAGAVPAGRNPDNLQPRIPAGSGAAGGGLGDLLQGGLGGLLAGGAAGGVLSGGLGSLLKQFEQAGLGEAASSWVSTGENKTISPGDLQKALGSDVIGTLASHTEMSPNELLSQLSQQLPAVIDRLTPQGRVPTHDEMSRLV